MSLRYDQYGYVYIAVLVIDGAFEKFLWEGQEDNCGKKGSRIWIRWSMPNLLHLSFAMILYCEESYYCIRVIQVVPSP